MSDLGPSTPEEEPSMSDAGLTEEDDTFGEDDPYTLWKSSLEAQGLWGEREEEVNDGLGGGENR
jgi:hypothetical protein